MINYVWWQLLLNSVTKNPANIWSNFMTKQMSVFWSLESCHPFFRNENQRKLNQKNSTVLSKSLTDLCVPPWTGFFSCDHGIRGPEGKGWCCSGGSESDTQPVWGEIPAEQTCYQCKTSIVIEYC